MKIIEVTREHIKFDNGNIITYDHQQDCCEYNYADFEQIDDISRDYDYPENLIFEFIEECGFRFGGEHFKTYIPCYSCQNGYYTGEIDIYYNGKKVCSGQCELEDDF